MKRWLRCLCVLLCVLFAAVPSAGARHKEKDSPLPS